ncbi:MAG: hypothetical protein LBB94_04970, partial [Clostridiales bacterium]|nr:hypothetical protein [Clostridiales bacterium]
MIAGYRRPTAEDLDFFRNIVTDPDRLLTGAEISEDYFHDELSDVSSVPDIVLKVLTEQEVTEIIRYARGR